MIRNILVLLIGALIGLSANAQTSSWPNPSKVPTSNKRIFLSILEVSRLFLVNRPILAEARNIRVIPDLGGDFPWFL